MVLTICWFALKADAAKLWQISCFPRMVQCPEDRVSFNTLLRAFDTTSSTSSPRIGTTVPGWSLGLLVLRAFLGSRLMPRVITFSASVSSCATARKNLELQIRWVFVLGFWEVMEGQGLLVRRPVGFQTS